MQNYKLAMEFYNRSIAANPDSPGKATAFGSKMSRVLRYYAAARLPFFDADSWQEKSVLDVGCGPGQFYNWLKEIAEAGEFSYSGIDPNQGMVNLAKKRGIDSVLCEDVFASDKQYDWIVANAIFISAFTENFYENQRIVEATIRKMWERCKYGMAFDLVLGEENSMLVNVDPKDPQYTELAFSPVWALDFCKSMAKRVLVDSCTSYRFFTVYMYKRDQLYSRLSEGDLQ